MFKDLTLKPVYYSKEVDIAENFYIPVLKEAISYDRVSAYFSAKALSSCATGIENFISNAGKCRLILSKDISEEDYNKIKLGYDLKDKLNAGLIEDLKQELSIDEQRKLSNLAYLIANNIIDIKIAFMKKGTFHYKFGIYRDDEDNIISSCGSNNFTQAALYDNAESFEITCSWLCSDWDYPKISNNIKKFENLWNNIDTEACVLDLDNCVKHEIIKYNKGKLFIDNAFIKENCIVLDYENSLKLYNKLDNKNDIKYTAFLNFSLKQYLDSVNPVTFKDDLNYRHYQKIIYLFEKYVPHINLQLTQRLKNYIDEKELYLNDRISLGLKIKIKNNSIIEKFEKYKEVLSKTMQRQLREQQLWDSFYMYTMRKSSNFSVPGSGKTSSVLGVYAYLNALSKVDRIIVISPKNAFSSWINEFKACFGDKQILKSFNIQDNISNSKKHEILTYNWQAYNMILVNFESVGSYREELRKIIEKGDALLVFDEVHRIKGVGKVYATNAIEIAEEANHVITMTGTPIPNTYADIYNNLHILFPYEYDTLFGFSPNFLKNPNQLQKEDINQKLKPFFCRTSKEDLHVPTANEDDIIHITSTDIENKLFNIVYSKYRFNKLALVTRILQLESNPQMLLESIDINEEFKSIFDVQDDIEELEYTDCSDDIKNWVKEIKISSKLQTCINLTLELVKNNKSVIIWTIFKKSISAICQELSKYGIAPIIISGDNTQEERLQSINQFNAYTGQVLITNPHTLAESVSLHNVCHDAIYYEYSYNLVHLLQSKDRIHRLGLPENQYTQYYFLQNIFNFKNFEYSLDNEIYDRLKLKEEIMLNAISNDELETIPSEEEDIDAIFKKLNI